jgi:hypothetical protein
MLDIRKTKSSFRELISVVNSARAERVGLSRGDDFKYAKGGICSARAHYFEGLMRRANMCCSPSSRRAITYSNVRGGDRRMFTVRGMGN